MSGRQPLLYGYKVALFYEGGDEKCARVGYLQSTWSTGPQSSAPVGMLPLSGREATPSTFEDCIFEIVSGDGELEQAKGKKHHEEVKFGQIIRLVHAAQGKPLCCSKKKSSAATDRSGKRVTIEPIKGKRDFTSKWRIAPRYQVRGEGEKVCDGDQVTLQPMISCGAHYLSVSETLLKGTPFLESSSTPKHLRDASGIVREIGFTIRAYDTQEAASSEALRGGDCVMLYHKEHQGYLLGQPADDEVSAVLLPDSQRTALEDKDPTTYLSNGMFIVELEDPLQGGAMRAASWNESNQMGQQRFRLRLLGNGTNTFYLTLKRQAPGAANLSRQSSTGRAGKPFRLSMGHLRRASVHPELNPRAPPQATRFPNESGEDTLQGWVATLCSSSEVKSDTGTLFQFLQTGDNAKSELRDTSRVILWANQAGLAKEAKKSVFLHVTNTPHVGSSIAGGLEVGCSLRPLQKDGFELRRVQPDAFLALNSVLSQIPPILEYIADLTAIAAGGTTKSPQPDRLLASLEEMIERCHAPQANPCDALDIDTTPDKVQQLLLVDQDVPRSCLRLLMAQTKLSFSLDDMLSPLTMLRATWGSFKSLPDMRPPTSSLRVARLCYKLIRSSVTGNADLASRVSFLIGEDGLEFMRGQASFKRDTVGAIPCLIELFRDNRELQTSLSTSFVEAVCSEVKGSRWRPENMRLLPHLFAHEDDVVERLQQAVTDMLMPASGGDADSDPPLISMKLERGEVRVKIPFTFGEDEDNEDPAWIPISQFCDVSDDIKNKVVGGTCRGAAQAGNSVSSVALRLDDIYEYLRYQVIMFAKLALGRPGSLQDRAQSVFAFTPKDVIFEIVLSRNSCCGNVVPEGLQCAFIQLACSLFLTNHPDRHRQATCIVKVWESFADAPVFAECDDDLAALKEGTKAYLTTATVHDCSYPSRIKKSACFVQLASFFVRGGFLCVDEISGLSSTLTLMLDGTTDRYIVQGQPTLPGAADGDSTDIRGEYSEFSKPLLELRALIVSCLSMMLDFMCLPDVLAVLDAMKAHVDNPSSAFKPPHLSQIKTFDPEDDIDDISKSNYVAPGSHNFLNKGMHLLTGGVASGIGAVADIGGQIGSLLGVEGARPYPEFNRLVEVLLDCSQYSYLPLRVAATQLLFRVCNRGPHIARTVESVQVLTSQRSVAFQKKAKECAERLQLVVEDCFEELSQSRMSEVKDKVEILTAMCYDEGKVAVEQQWILAQLGVHSVLLNAPWMRVFDDALGLQRGGLTPSPELSGPSPRATWKDAGTPSPKRSGSLLQSIKSTVRATVVYLTTLTKANDDNQELILETSLHIILRILPTSCGALELLEQLFEGNTRRCIQSPDALISALLTSPLRTPFVSFLMMIMRPENRNLFRKQKAVYTHVADYWAQEINFVGSEQLPSWTGGKKLRYVEEKLRTKEYLNVEGKVAGHLSVVHLLKGIAKGKDVSLKRDIRTDVWVEKYADPLDHVMNLVSKHELPMWYRAAWLRLFMEVFVDDDDMISPICSQKSHDGKYHIVKLMTLLAREVAAWPAELYPKPPSSQAVPTEPTSDVVSFTGSSASSAKGVSFVAAEEKPDLVASVHLSGAPVVADYLFWAVMPCVKHLMHAYFARAFLHADADVYSLVVPLFAETVAAFIRIGELQRDALRNTALPGAADVQATEVAPASYVDLVDWAIRHPGAPHPAADAGGSRLLLLLPAATRVKLAEFVRAAATIQTKLRMEIPARAAEGFGTISYRSSKAWPTRVMTDEERLFAEWRKCLKRLHDEPYMLPGNQFKTLALMLLRKGVIGRRFIQETVIGLDAEGLIFQAGVNAGRLQLDCLQLLARLCDSCEAKELVAGRGGDDANIVVPKSADEKPYFYLPKIAEEDAQVDPDAAVFLSDNMNVREKQSALNSFGMAERLVSLVEGPSGNSMGLSKTTLTALTTGSALLAGGNTAVQDSIVAYFFSRNDEGFFINVRSQLRKFSESLKDLRRTLKKEVAPKQDNPLKALEDSALVLVERELVTSRVDGDDDGDESPSLNLKTERLPDSLVVDMADRFCISHMVVLFEFLQLMCEGHNLTMQNYLREQSDNHTSIDLVETTVSFLDNIKYLNRINAPVVIASLRCLIEFVQGPCPENQNEMVSQNIGELLCCVLNDGTGPKIFKADLSGGDDPEAQEALWLCRELCVTLLIGLTEEGTGNELEDKLNLGCGIFIFLKIVLDTQTLREIELGNKETISLTDRDGKTIKQILRRTENACFQFFNRTVANIEIARGDKVERVYFRVLLKSKINLPERSKEDVKNAVQRDSGDGVRVADFFDKCLGLIHEIDYYEDMRNTRGLAVVHKLAVPLEWFSLLMSFLINLYLLNLVYYVHDDTASNVRRGDQEWTLNLFGRTIIALQCLQMLHFGMGPTRIYLNFKWREWEQLQEDDAMRESKANMSVHPVNRDSCSKDRLPLALFCAYSVQMILQFWPFWQRAVYLLCSFLGFYMSPVWYCVQPLQVIGFSPKLMNVVLAVTTNGKSLLLTFGLMLIVVYMFASWAFFRFSNYFDEEGDFGPGFNCDTLFRCWILLMTYGVRQGGGIGDIMARPNWSDEMVGERILFDMLYFLVLIILFLNIVFGIIIDTFAELREKREFIDDDQQSKCFVCGMERSVFDREAGAQGGFEHHYRSEHNMWTYLLFLHYIKEKPEDELTGQEKYVHDLLQNKDPGFFPVGKSLVLSKTEEDPADNILERIHGNMADRTQVERVSHTLAARI
eukprot:gene2291-3543_t